MNNRNPRVDVLMPVYNCESYIDQALDAMQAQTLEDWRLIAVDDASTDGTIARIEARRDPRIQIIRRQQNGGVAAALQSGLPAVTAPYTARMDGDDLCPAHRFQKQVEALENHPQWALVRCYVELFADNPDIAESDWFKIKKELAEPRYNQPMSPEQISETLWSYQCITQGGIMIRSHILKHYGYHRLPIAEDYKLFYEMNRDGHRVGTVPEVLYRYRVVQGSASQANQPRQMETVYEHIKKVDIRRFFQSGDPVFIWGTGGQGQTLRGYLEKDNLKIAGYIDYQPKTNHIDGLPVHPALPFLDLRQPAKILIAAQPVMNRIIADLKSRQRGTPHDYLVFV